MFSYAWVYSTFDPKTNMYRWLGRFLNCLM
jgi:hypothetical protein